MHGQTWLLCKIFLEISNINNIIAYGNTLINPAFDKINGDDSFDFIIANPPFGVDWKHDYIEVIKNMELKDKSNFYVIKDEIGIHARPAGLLVKEAGKFQSAVTLKSGAKSGDAKRIFGIMGMAVKQNDEVTIEADGAAKNLFVTSVPSAQIRVIPFICPS